MIGRLARNALALVLATVAFGAMAENPYIVVASTTSTQQSGLFPKLLPAFEKEHGHQRARGRRRHRPGAGHRAPRRLRRRVRARPGRRAQVPGGGPRRQAVPGHVQRFRADRSQVRSGTRCRGQGHRGRAARGERGTRAVRLARRQERHLRGRAQAVEGGRHRHRGGEGTVVPRNGFRHGAGPQHRVGHGRLYPLRPRDLAQFPQSREPRRRRPGRQASVQPVWRDAGQSRQAPARSRRIWGRSSSTGWCRRAVRP